MGNADAVAGTLRAKMPDAAFKARTAFRAASAADVAALVPMINDAYMREAHVLPPPRTSNDALGDDLAAPQTRVIIAEVDGALAGCVRVRLAEGEAWFGLLATAPAVQGRGMASMLIAEAEALARKEGAAAMLLECAEELGMPPYYASLGYVIASREPDAYFKPRKGPFTRIVMRKALT